MKDLAVKYWPFFSILVISIIFFWKFFFLGLIPIPADIITGVSYPWRDYFLTSVHNPIISDAISFSYPMRMLSMDLLKSGKLPLWNPYILFGTPLLANFQSAPFSPTNILYFILSKHSAWGVQIVIQHVFAAVFTYLLLRYWKVSNFGSLVGGIIYAFSGFNIVWSPWNGHVLVASFIPLLILLSDKFLEERQWKIGLGVSLILALQILSGYPQVVLYTLLALFILWLTKIKNNSKKIITSIFFFLFVGLGIGLSAFQVLPGIELLRQSQRVTEPIPVEWAFLNAKEIIKFVSSEFYGNHVSGDFWGPKNYTSTVGFVGVAAFILSLIGLAKYKKTWLVKYLVVIIIFSLVISFINPLSLFLWQKNILGLQAGVSWRIMVLFNLAISALAGMGIDNLDLSRKKLISALALPFLILIIFLIYAINLPLNGSTALMGLLIPFVVFGLSFFAIIFRSKQLFLVLTIAELFLFGWKYTTFSQEKLIFPSTPILDYLVGSKVKGRVNTNNVIPVNFNMIYSLKIPQGYDAVYPERTAKYLATINSGDSNSKAQDRYGLINTDTKSRLLDLAGVSTTLRIEKAVKGDIFTDKSLSISKNNNALPHQFYVSDWVVEKDVKIILRKLLDSTFDIKNKIILEEEPPKETKGFILVSDTWYPGWHAYVDGAEAKIYRADYNFRAVAVDKASSEVQFIYKPSSFFYGLYLSLASLLVLAFLYPISRFAAKISFR